MTLGRSPRPPADLVLMRGRVMTFDEGRPMGEAIAVGGGRILAVGSNQEVDRLIGPDTRAVDLAGRTVIPGLTDCHVHLATDASTHDSVDVRDLFHDVRTIDDILDRLRERAAAVAPGTWIAARGSPMQAYRLEERRLPTRVELDRAAPEHPTYVTFGAHILVANSAAIAARGVNRDTPDPDRGMVDKDPRTGEPTGLFLERAAILIRGPSQPADPEFMDAAIELELEHCLRRGVTTIHDVVAARSEVQAYQRLRLAGRVRPRVMLLFRVVHSELAGDGPIELGLLPGFGDTDLWFGGVKVSVDGGFTGGNAVFQEPLASALGRPLLRVPPDELVALIERYDAAGIRVAVHAMGDAALDIALDAYERRVATAPIGAARHRIEHMGNWQTTALRLERARRLGVIPVPNPSMFYHLADEICEALGPQRSAAAFQLGAIGEAGLPLVFGSDGPGYWSIDVLRDVATAVSRHTRSGTRLGEASPLRLEAALQAQTVTAAWLGFREADLGRLAAGMRADLAVLADDPFAGPPEAVGSIDVDYTVVDGAIAFARAL
jgi:predicted amidohydrolase YtcJ